MKTVNAQTLQFRLSLDQRLKNTWTYLMQTYQTLDKAEIIKLALNSLEKEAKRSEYKMYSIDEVLSELENREVGMTEEEAFEWWNKNKSSF